MSPGQRVRLRDADGEPHGASEREELPLVLLEDRVQDVLEVRGRQRGDALPQRLLQAERLRALA